MTSKPYTEWEASPKVLLGELGAQPPLPEVAEEFQSGLHQFAEHLMRPIGQRLDRLSAEEVAAGG